MDKSMKRGFTLIELLVVIAIIAILAAILFPVFLRAKRSATETKCINNQKQLGVAMMRYLDDYNGGFPYAGQNCIYWYHNLSPKPTGQGGKYASCAQALLPYVSGNKDVFFCPLWKASPEHKDYPGIDWSYWYFCGHSPQSPIRIYAPKSALCGYSMSDVKRPSVKPALTEINAPHSQGDKDDMQIGQTQVYCDGHTRLARGSWAQIWAIGYVGRDGSPAPPLP